MYAIAIIFTQIFTQKHKSTYLLRRFLYGIKYHLLGRVPFVIKSAHSTISNWSGNVADISKQRSIRTRLCYRYTDIEVMFTFSSSDTSNSYKSRNSESRWRVKEKREKPNEYLLSTRYRVSRNSFNEEITPHMSLTFHNFVYFMEKKVWFYKDDFFI